MEILRLGLPKGSLEATTIELFKKSGWKVSTSSRSYSPALMTRPCVARWFGPRKWPRYVEFRYSGCRDHRQRLGHGERRGCRTDYRPGCTSKASFQPTRWVLAIPQESPIQDIGDLNGKKIATELVRYTKRYFDERGIRVEVEFSWGATEAKAADGLVDAIVEVTESGSTIRAHGLKIIHELFRSNPADHCQ